MDRQAGNQVAFWLLQKNNVVHFQAVTKKVKKIFA